MTDSKTKAAIKRLLLRAARFPLLLVAIGATLIALSYMDLFPPLVQWKRFFDIADQVGLAIIVFSIALFIYNFTVLLCKKYEARLWEKNTVASVVLSIIRKGLRIIFLLVVINIIITMLSPVHIYFSFMNNLINTIIIASVGWIAIQILYAFDAVFQQRLINIQHKEHISFRATYTKIHILRNVATVLIVIITLAIILMSYSSVRNIGISLLASAGFLTAIIGLAAQRTLISLFAGLQIALSHPIKIGDMVVIENESGVIEEITLSYVVLKLGDRRRLMIPIHFFIEKPFENWSHEGQSMRTSFHMHVDYLMPIEPLRNELDNILQQSTFWDKAAQKLQVSDIQERSVELRVQISAANADDLSDLRAEVKEKMLEFMRTQYPAYFPNLRFSS